MTQELFLYSKSECPLCDEFRDELQRHGILHQLVKIDGDLELTQRYGARIPVLVSGNEVVCEGRFRQSIIQKFLDGAS